jgi:leucyl-tRNA synthetase
MGDYSAAAPWNESSMKGCKRFLERVADLKDKANGTGVTAKLETAFHKTIKKVSSDIEEMKFNTAIAAMMGLLNDIDAEGKLTVDELKIFVKLLCPFAPHLCEEIWEGIGETGLCSEAAWPAYDENKTVDATVEIALQICGKFRGTLMIARDASKEEMLAAAKADSKIAAQLEGKQILKEIVVPGKLVNIVAK